MCPLRRTGHVDILARTHKGRYPLKFHLLNTDLGSRTSFQVPASAAF
jgi:hypothetical protein